MADANRTLVTRAEYNTIIVPATGRKALVMDGATVELGSTGLRDVTGLCVPGSIASGRLLVERIGSVVAWVLDALVLANGNGTTNISVLDSTAPATMSMFRPKTAVMDTMMINSGGQMVRLSVTTTPGFQVNFGRAGVAMSTRVIHTTEAGWATTLPGVANGEPIGA